MTKKNEIVTDSNVHYKQAKHAIRKALQMSKQSTQQDEIEMYDEHSTCSKPAAPPSQRALKPPSSKISPPRSLIFGPPRATHYPGNPHLI
jgi:hypothetical protein